MERLGKSSRWLAARHAMLRFGEECGALAPKKCPTEANRSDILTKPSTGRAFVEHRAAVLGLGPEHESLTAGGTGKP
jgi:hypothetical protein